MKRILLAFLLIEIICAACTNQEYAPEDLPSIKDEKTGEGFLILKLSAPESVISRAETENSGVFKDGSESENTINLVRFFFFHVSGEPYKVKYKPNSSPNYVSYVDWTPSNPAGDSGGNGNNGNNSTLATATLTIDILNGTNPSKIVAIVNPENTVKSLKNPSLETLSQVAEDFCTGFTDYNFVMSNSVYAEGNLETRKVVCPVEINDINISESEEILPVPLEIYVERAVARIEFDFDEGPGALVKATVKDYKNTYKTGMKFKPVDSDIEKEIYIQFLGWALTSTPKKSYLLKHIDKVWEDNAFPRDRGAWNMPDLHRSFWAVNPPQLQYQWYSFNDISGLESREAGVEGCYDIDDKIAYTQENANPYGISPIEGKNPDYPTKAIFAARYIDSQGEPIPMAEYQSASYTIEGLLSMIANQLDMYSVSGSTYTKITPTDLTLETYMEHERKEGPNVQGSFNVFFKLSETGRGKRWVHKPIANETPVAIPNPDQFIDNSVLPAKVWRNGYTYYYFDIPHFHTSEGGAGSLGVVRNHIYNAKIRSISTLGTPVYNPEELIYPEKPEEESIMEVTINVLEWRLMRQKLQVSW